MLKGIKSQNGYIAGGSKGLGTLLVVCGLCCAGVGWGVIEFIIWLLTFVHFGVGA